MMSTMSVIFHPHPQNRVFGFYSSQITKRARAWGCGWRITDITDITDDSMEVESRDAFVYRREISRVDLEAADSRVYRSIRKSNGSERWHEKRDKTAR